jgi:UDP-N-acetyl-D-glucosamine dehydrogenase
MPHFVVAKIQNALNDLGKPLKGSRVHILGVAYKKDISDLRESPAVDVMLLLKQRGAILSYADPYVPAVKLDGLDLYSEADEAVGAADCVAIITNHSSFNYRSVVDRALLVIDTRNACKDIESEKIVRL